MATGQKAAADLGVWDENPAAGSQHFRWVGDHAVTLLKYGRSWGYAVFGETDSPSIPAPVLAGAACYWWDLDDAKAAALAAVAKLAEGGAA